MPQKLSKDHIYSEGKSKGNYRLDEDHPFRGLGGQCMGDSVGDCNSAAGGDIPGCEE